MEPRGALLDQRHGRIPKGPPVSRAGQQKVACFDLALDRLSQSVAKTK